MAKGRLFKRFNVEEYHLELVKHQFTKQTREAPKDGL
jgi:hypothetical protein